MKNNYAIITTDFGIGEQNMKKIQVMISLCMMVLCLNLVQAATNQKCVYVSTKEAVIREEPLEEAKGILTVPFSTELYQEEIVDEIWSRVTVTKENGESVTGYIETVRLSEEELLESCDEIKEVFEDCDVLDYPGKRDGEVIGEVLEMDAIQRTAVLGEVWSQIVFEDKLGQSQTGYIPTSVLEKEQKTGSSKTEENGGIISESEGEGIFAEAEEVIGDATVTANGAGVLEGNPVAASSDSALLPLGVFRITHYCPCSICCGPWANGITSTGRTAVTNHTIAVDPTQIPYGSKVVINGQVYVAEDCGGAIKQNCIDIYVATHEEGESKGVFYTEVYLIQE